MEFTNPIIDRFNAIGGAVVAILTYMFGKHWWLFAVFLGLNVCDELTGWYKAKVNNKENSHAGWIGVAKKMIYWMMIALAFAISEVFIHLGMHMGIDLGVTQLFGWFVLASLFINEIRSIIENLVEAHVYVPEIMKKGLEVADKVLKEAEDVMDDTHEDHTGNRDSPEDDA